MGSDPVWMLSIGRARHPGPCNPSGPPGCCIEFLNVGGWLSRGDLAPEHRLVPAMARNVTTQLRKVRRSSVWAPSMQGWVSSVSMAPPLSLPTLFHHSFKEFFRMRVVFTTGQRGIAHLFVICGYQGAESDPEKLTLTDNLLAAVLAEAKVCCAGQPVILVGDLNADPSVIPSLAKGVSGGSWIDVEKAFATGKGVAPALACQFQLCEDKGSRRDFTLACPTAVAATTACCVLPDFARILQSARSSLSVRMGRLC